MPADNGSGEVLTRDNLSSDHDPLYKFHQWQANSRFQCLSISSPATSSALGGKFCRMCILAQTRCSIQDSVTQSQQGSPLWPRILEMKDWRSVAEQINKEHVFQFGTPRERLINCRLSGMVDDC
jgi:hypothetical protein